MYRELNEFVYFIGDCSGSSAFRSRFAAPPPDEAQARTISASSAANPSDSMRSASSKMSTSSAWKENDGVFCR